MRKSQILVLVFAFGLVAVLYSMPKVLVHNKSEAITAASADTDTHVSASTDGSHTLAISPEVKNAISELRNKFLSSTETEKKIIFADSLAALYQQAALLDSAAGYRQVIADLAPSVSHWIQAGDSYYEAFSFAVDNTKANAYGEKARNYYQKVLDKEPGRLEAKAKMAMTYVTTSNPMQGIMMLREVIEKDPTNELALLNLGLLSIQSGQYDKAAERFQQILANNPSHTQAQFYLGISYAELGKKHEAIQLLEQVLNSSQEEFIRNAAEEYLKNLK